MKHANNDGLLDTILERTIRMDGRMIHGRKQNGDLFEESQAYDINGRVRLHPAINVFWWLTAFSI